MKKKKGRFLIRSGLLLIAAAVALGAYNVYDGHRAGSAVQESVNFLEQLIAPADERIDDSGSAYTADKNDGQDSVPADLNTASGGFFEIPDEEEAERRDEIQYDEDPIVLDEIVIPDYILNPDMEMPVERYNGQDYIGILEIPAIDLKLPVISQWSYPKLRIAPCRYAGSAYTNNLVISAHNYAAHFGNIDKLFEGAAVIFTDTDGNVFNYRVGAKETLGPRDSAYMKDSGWDLTLFTCTPGGSYRVTVRCALVKGI